MGLNTDNMAPKKEDVSPKGAFDPREHAKRIKGLFTQTPDNSVADAAAAAESVREREINGTTARINDVFDSPGRQSQYAEYVAALRGRYADQLNRGKQVADRQNKFAIARSGLTGGSRDVDSRRDLGEKYLQQLLGAEEKAQAAGADLRGEDSAARTNLIGLANNGLDATTAATRSITGLQQRANMARTEANSEGFADAFGAAADAYSRKRNGDTYKRAYENGYGGGF